MNTFLPTEIRFNSKIAAPHDTEIENDYLQSWWEPRCVWNFICNYQKCQALASRARNWMCNNVWLFERICLIGYIREGPRADSAIVNALISAKDDFLCFIGRSFQMFQEKRIPARPENNICTFPVFERTFKYKVLTNSYFLFIRRYLWYFKRLELACTIRWIEIKIINVF